MWYRMKVLRIRYNLYAGTEPLSLSVYEPIAMPFFVGGPSPIPNFRYRVELGGRMWYRVRVLRIRYNLFAGTETLSLSVYEPITLHI